MDLHAQLRMVFLEMMTTIALCALLCVVCLSTFSLSWLRSRFDLLLLRSLSSLGGGNGQNLDKMLMNGEVVAQAARTIAQVVDKDAQQVRAIKVKANSDLTY